MTGVRTFEGIDTVTPVLIASGLDDGARSLMAELKAAIEGEVRFDAGSRAAYSTDSSNYRQVPIGVVIPKTVDDVVATMIACHRHGVPITSRGGGTSLAGQCTNVAVILDFSKYLNRVVSIDPEARSAVVEPGCNLDHLRSAAAEHGLTFGPDPATHNRNTLGGMIGNNSCGVHSVMAEFYGPGPLTVDQVIELDLLTYDGHRMLVGAHSPDEVDAVIAASGHRGELYRRLRDLRDRHDHAIRTGFPQIPRRVSGFNLDRLLDDQGFDVAKSLVGTEGTCVVVLQATVRLIEARPKRALVVLGYPDVYTAGDHVPLVREHRPVGLEGFDAKVIDDMRKKGLYPDDIDLLPEGDGFLLVEFGGDTQDDADSKANAFAEAISQPDDAPNVKRFEDEWEQQKLWHVREAALGATSHVPGQRLSHPSWEDAAVPPESVGDYLRDFRDLLEEFGYEASLYGHFGQGCIHCRVDFVLDRAQGVAQWRTFLDRAADLVVSYGGSLSGEHGDGQARAALLGKMYGAELVGAFAEFKDLWDPDGKMNPGKVVRPNQPTDDLRMGPDATLRRVDTHFAFPDDDHDFANAVDRCVGVGLCRDVDAGTMCPSYMATREEADSTRGRSRLLFEMLRSDDLDGWRDDAVADALDLCLACKGCKVECPVNVDMATYKAEFLSHYYERRLRPRNAYAMGLIYWWARLASRAPRLVNAVAHAPGLSTLLKRAGGIAVERDVPRFARTAFTAWFRARVRSVEVQPEQPVHDGTMDLTHGEVPRYAGARYSTPSMQHNAGRNVLHPHGDDAPFITDRVLLWPDTFNNYLESNVLQAAVEVLEDAGYAVEIPPRPLCCGRPLYDFGMLDTAERLWRQTLRTLRPWIRAGVPVVGLEPSCVAAFRDELVGLFPNDNDARRLSDQTLLLSEFLERQRYAPPDLHVRATVHGHCHHESVIGMDAEVALLKRMGVDHEVLDSGCCGMAGSFGFSAEHYEVSMRVGERVLLPAARQLDSDAVLVTDGFSCREQITQSTDRTPVHLAELLQQAIKADGPRHSSADQQNVDDWREAEM
ncbi:MAG: FAD-binding and (Fe-S)-binding domain-containing protein [Acidimicrobiales bacterium]